MTAERWDRIQELFYAADELAGDGREAFLRTQCGDDADLQREVRHLLAAASHDPGRVEQCVGAAAGQILATVAPDIKRIGHWEVIRPLGEGGMGVVFLARRADETYDQQVAIKIIRPGFALETARARFRSERQILAGLAHPNIARLLDGGVTEAGQPYYVMEYVDGQPIDQWCRTHGIALRQKLELFRAVCAGVQWAHQNLVVHRDIKPANILVCADGTPKLLDFGIAKPLDPAASASDAMRTRATDRLLTPEYASPEQILGQPATTATDVYGLGVLLYELLAGRRPFELPSPTPLEIQRAICESSPPKPSTASGKSLQGDLNNIVLKAMHREPSRRYASAGEFSEDIRRHLEGFPVLARPDSVGYRAGKFVRRHRKGVIAASLFVALLIGSVIGMAILAGRAAAQRARAEQVSAFLVRLFSVADPGRTRPSELTAREMLDRGAAEIDDLRAEPEVQAKLLETFGLVYENLGAPGRSRDLLRRSLAVKRRLYDADSLEIAANLKQLAELSRQLGEYGEGEKMARESIAIRRKRLGPRDALLAESQNALALILQATGRLKEAEQLFLTVLSQRELLPQREHLETAVLSNLGGLYADLGDLASAERYLIDCVAMRRQQLGPKHPRLALALAKLAQVQESEGKLDQAEAAAHESLAMRRQVFSDRHPDVGRSLVGLASLQRRRGRFPEARESLTEAAQIFRDTTADPDAVSAWNFQDALLRESQGDLGGAERSMRQCVDQRRALRGDRNRATGRALVNLGRIVSRQGRGPEAIAVLEQGIGALASVSAADPELAEAKTLLASLRAR